MAPDWVKEIVLMCSWMKMSNPEEIDPGTPMAQVDPADLAAGPGPDAEMGGDHAYPHPN
jgi:hypothetical protein